MRQQLINTANLIVLIGVSLLAFLLPIFFLRTTSEFFELNKQMLLIGVVGILLIVWTVKMVVQRKVVISVSSFSLPLLAMLAAYVISTVFSVDQFVSIFGYHPRFAGNILQVVAGILGFFILVSNLKDINALKIISHSFVASSFLLSVYSIFLNYITANSAQYTNLVKNLPTVVVPTNGSPNIAAVVFVAAIFAGIGLLLNEKNSGVKSYLSLAIALIGIGLVFTGSMSGIIVLAVVTVIGLFFQSKLNLENKKQQLSFILPAVVAVLLFGVLLNIPNSPFGKFKSQTEPMLSLESSWRIASAAVGIRPIQGIGPGTYAYAYSQFKPTELNLGETGGLRFDRAYNFPLEIMTTTGILGIVTYLWLVIAYAVIVLRHLVKVEGKGVDKILYFNILTSLALLVAQFVVYPNTIIFTMFLVFAAMVLCHLKWVGAHGITDVSLILGAVREGFIKLSETDDPNRLGRKYEILPYVFLLVAIAITVPAFYFTGINYVADTHYKKAIDAFNNNRAQETLQGLVQAIQTQPRREVYHVSLSQADLAILRAIARDPKNASPSAEVQQDIQNLGRQAIEQATIATRVAPKNAFTYAYLGDVYKELAGNNIDALRSALTAYVASSNLDPNNYQLRVVIGDLYLRTNDFDRAADYFSAAINLKGDDPNPRYLLAVSQARNADVKMKSDKPEDKVAGYQARLNAINSIQSTLNVLGQVTKDKNQDAYKQQVERLNKEIEDQKKKAESEKPAIEKILRDAQAAAQQGGQATGSAQPQTQVSVTPTPTTASGRTATTSAR